MDPNNRQLAAGQTPSAGQYQAMDQRRRHHPNESQGSGISFQSSFQSHGHSESQGSLMSFPSASYQGVFGQQPSSQHPISAVEESSQIHQQIFNLSQTITRLPGISSQVSTYLASELRALSQLITARNHSLQLEQDAIKAERENIQESLNDKQRLVQNALAERDRACVERDTFGRDLEDMRTSHRRFVEDHNATARDTSAENNLRERIRYLEEQLEGKRDLWRDYHPSSSRRQVSSVVRDPYATPSNRRTSSSANVLSSSRHGGPMVNLRAQFEQMQATSTPPITGQNRPASMVPFGPPNTVEVIPSHSSMASRARTDQNQNPATSSETSTTSEEVLSDALVPFKTMDEIASDLIDGIGGLYKLVHTWATLYTSSINPISADQTIQDNSNTWRMIMASVHPYSGSDATSHVIWLLRTPETRPWLVMRLVVEVIVNNAWSESAWHDFDPEITVELKSIQARLEVRGLDNKERADLQDKRKAIIQGIVDGRRYPAFRQMCLAKLTKHIRDLVGPFLDRTIQRSEAGRELSSFCGEAFDLSSKILCSGWTLITEWPRVGDRFLSTKMVARNSDEEPMALHICQARLKMVITPTMTMRDDHRNTITVKQLENASVLVQ